MTLDVHTLDQFLLVGAGVLLIALAAIRVSVGVGLPSLLLYLGIGVALGDAGFGLRFEDAELAHALGFAALVVILAEGGLTTPWTKIRPVLRMGIALATVGIGVSVLVVALFAHYVLSMSWEISVLLGAVTSPTDAAAVFSVLRRVPLPGRLTGTLEAESGLNDAPTVVLVSAISVGGSHSVWGFLGLIVAELSVGVVIGLVVGFAGVWMMRRVALPSSGLYPLAVLSFAVLAYAGASTLHTSGFAAVYVAALVLGNADLPHRVATRSFSEGLAWIAQIGLFVMLGLLVSPGAIDLRTVLLAVVAGLVLTFVARPVSVFLVSVVQPMPVRELAFLSWAGLRGAVPIVLCTIPLSEDVEGSGRLFNIVFVLAVVYTLVTGPTLPLVARLLGVAQRSEPRELEVEAAPLERIAADLLQITISAKSRMHGVEVGELRLPRGSSVSLVVRDGTTLVPERRTVLKRGDDILVVTTRRERETTEKRLRTVSLHGRLARWSAEERPRSAPRG
ncbi:K+/H+ antiporter [Marmoricola endophyticus]|uniref:K+/H+ antiporter n=1 Tax=Marmoricola endophyticus TaxID=2040280 RepID=A0A917BLD3_9ACTN|nr:potassium/proton antiporter [Marmoricola endophyticus]GGF48909.1 K+/H+ antiporter [Marmoricola endophyticus]